MDVFAADSTFDRKFEFGRLTRCGLKLRVRIGSAEVFKEDQHANATSTPNRNQQGVGTLTASCEKVLENHSNITININNKVRKTQDASPPPHARLQTPRRQRPGTSLPAGSRTAARPER